MEVVTGKPSTGLLACSPKLPHQSVKPSQSNIDDKYATQLAELISLVKMNNKQYEEQTGNKPVTSSVFGTGEPLRLKVNVLSNNENTDLSLDNANIEDFTDTNSSGNNRLTQLLNNYEANRQVNNDTIYLNSNDIPKCKKINYSNYVSNRVGQCNCKLTN